MNLLEFARAIGLLQSAFYQRSCSEALVSGKRENLSLNSCKAMGTPALWRGNSMSNRKLALLWMLVNLRNPMPTRPARTNLNARLACGDNAIFTLTIDSSVGTLVRDFLANENFFIVFHETKLQLLKHSG
jgi:hypothetical protein